MKPVVQAMHQNQPCLRLSLPDGDGALISLFGAQVLTWQTADGAERLYLSPKAAFDGISPIRGGVPICFPQFNQRVLQSRALAKHGFARTLRWHQQSATIQEIAEDAAHAANDESTAQLTLALSDDDLPATVRAIWPHQFLARLTVRLRPGRLRIAFSVHNTGSQPWPFALAMHTYLRVDDITTAELSGLQGKRYWDAVTHLAVPSVTHMQDLQPICFGSETDRVYQQAPSALWLRQTRDQLRIEQSASFSETVVWNPGAALCSQLADMPADGYRHMLCIEAAKIDNPIMLATGKSWHGWQQFACEPP